MSTLTTLNKLVIKPRSHDLQQLPLQHAHAIELFQNLAL